MTLRGECGSYTSTDLKVLLLQSETVHIYPYIKSQNENIENFGFLGHNNINVHVKFH